MHQDLDKHRLRHVQQADLLVDLGQPRTNWHTVERHGLAGVPWQDERLRWQREELVQAVVEQRGARSRFLGVRVQVGTPDAGRKERVTGKEEGVVEQVAGTLRRVSWRMYRGERQLRGRERVTVAHGCEGKGHALLLRQKQHRPAVFGELARTREMIGVNVGVEDAADLSPVLRSQVEIHLGVKGGIDHERFLTCANQIGEAAFAGAPHLDHPHRAIR